MVRLLSLVSAMMLTQLEGKDTLHVDSGYNVLDVVSLDMAKIRMLAKEEKKAEVVTQWIKVLIIESMNKGILTVPPPILTRVFQELDLSMGKYHEAERFSQVPFPFPYAATLDLLMVLHTLITPVVMMSLLGHHTFLPIFITSMVAFMMWNMHLIPGELENPYDGDMNDLDLEALQDDLNEKLKAICSVAPGSVPRLCVHPEHATSFLTLCKRSRSHLNIRRRRSVNSKDIWKRQTLNKGSSNFSYADHVRPTLEYGERSSAAVPEPSEHPSMDCPPEPQMKVLAEDRPFNET
eukprot:CAMPEP_0194496250 /NCGR_PEP_ID=MMETSP0253-20130528/13587_1 /TAXON_ID=2966 /ORGANISM="Noctiluca scintillans" /LENGTH=292 /DNA_ID=CAMNT_0039337625 /DNA_START=12 /DNA_END=887 /DNA_ORIENTATION=+